MADAALKYSDSTKSTNFIKPQVNGLLCNDLVLRFTIAVKNPIIVNKPM